jgi:rhomboid protease GluP
VSARRVRTPATTFLIGAILAGFGIEVLTGAWIDGDRLARLGAIVPALVRQGEYWRLLTAMFLHGDGTIGGDILHLGLNLLALFQLGSLYEVMFGTRRFVLIYFVSGIAASIASYMHAAGASVGASGAIFGILGAFIFSVWRSPRWRHERAARSIVRQLIFLIFANIAIGMKIPQIDLAAHLGGLVTGLILGALLPHHTPPPPPGRVVVDVRPYDEGSFEDPAARRFDR